MDLDFRVPVWFDYAATLAWAMSGAVVGIRKRFDLTGVFVIALLSATGGGLVRDAIFLTRVPAFLLDPVYLLLVAATTAFMALFTRPITRLLARQTVSKTVDLIDAVGIPAFAVIGMQLAQERNIPLMGVALVGIVNGTAGGLLRDVVVRDVPTLLRPGQMVTLSLAIASGLYLVMRRYYGIGPSQAAWVTIGVFFLFRVLAVRFNWQTRALGDDAPVSET
jgi:uncharacterized membrane protein YeiH